jgi:hypothetical protein
MLVAGQSEATTIRSRGQSVGLRLQPVGSNAISR